MTRTPAPTGDAELDEALREAALQWRLDFEVPPMPLLDSGSQPLEVHPSARLRWTRPVLVAASIIALGAVAAVVISAARPTGQVAGPSVSAGPSLSARTSLSSGPVTSQAPAPDPVWPVPGLQTLDILDGTPPPSITIGGSVYRMASATPPVDVVTDSDHPNFLGVTPQSNASPCFGIATRIYLDRTSSGTITLSEASYQREGISGPCPEMAVLSGPKYGLAPYAIAGQKLVAAGSDAALQHVDLADYHAPRYLPDGYELSSSLGLASAWGSGKPPGSRVDRVLTLHRQPSTKDITLTWQDPAVGNAAAPRPSTASRVIACATRILTADLAVTACGNTIDPQRPVTVAELQRVVDSIPD
ncbi:hypothetical protein ABLG96_06165 [Nakamurella sp. A5-74]|uniref:PknH-like extracellular domain-containing protein n=1 Tax=Nakamurella sp. A5-74 TaxID=3158264 RepID=A0AAU8DRG6_9ACTN